MRRWTRPLPAEPDRVILSNVWTTSTCYKPLEIERACLVIGQMILAPEFEGLRDDPIERSRFRLRRWSTHVRAFSYRMGQHKPAIPPERAGGISHSKCSTKSCNRSRTTRPRIAVAL